MPVTRQFVFPDEKLVGPPGPGTKADLEGRRSSDGKRPK